MVFKPDSKVLVQGICEPQGSIYAAQMKAYGTNIVAGISVGEGGQLVHDIPVFDLVEQAVQAVGAIDITLIFVPPYDALDAALEAIAAGIQRIIIVTRGVPPLDMVQLLRKAEATSTLIIGPSSPGILMPGKILLGTQETEFYTPGHVALLTRTGTLTSEIALALTQSAIGQSIAVSLGSEPVVGSSFVRWLQILAEDKNTKAIVLVDQTGVGREEGTAEFIVEAVDKPVIAYFVGRHVHPEPYLGHADTISLWRKGAALNAQMNEPSAEVNPVLSQIAAFKKAKIPIAVRPSQIPELVKKALKK